MDIETLARAATATERIVGGVAPAQHGMPTPCTAWDVRQLLNHLLGALLLGRALFRGTQPEVAVGPGNCLSPTSRARTR